MITPIVKGAAYILVHVPDLVRPFGTTCAMEKKTNPESEFLVKVPQYLRTYQEAVRYPPNQVYIGNLDPDELPGIPRPWYKNLLPEAKPQGKMGEIIAQEEFYAALKQSDVFDLVMLERAFQAETIMKLSANHLYKEAELANFKASYDLAEIEKIIEAGAEPLHCADRLVGCVKAAHSKDENLSAHVMLENLVVKASGVLALKNLIIRSNIAPDSIEYVIECSEEACGDMNQRGGGNFAKAICETAGAVGATGLDTRGFCAAPTHALIQAAALVKAGVFRSVAVVAGGALAKLGMNSRDHVHKGVPVLEDCLGGFAVLVTENDGISPVIRTDLVGRHTVGTGSAPQAVMESLITKPLDKVGLKISDIDKFSVEMQNPEITEPAGAGDVPLANFKMIAALGAKRGDIDKAEMPAFITNHGMPGFAPTQGHIPSGVPYVGHARRSIMEGKITRAMIVGKGSLFLGRMTSQFDGVSVIIEKNPGLQPGNTSIKPMTGEIFAEAVPILKTDPGGKKVRVGLTTLGSEHGIEELVKGAEMAQRKYGDLSVILLGPRVETALEQVIVLDEEEMHHRMDRMLDSGELDAAVTMHYNFPLGVATVGRILAPATGMDLLLATTTGTASANRVTGMVYNAISGISTAKALGIAKPTVGIVNVDGARQVERALKELQNNGYPLDFDSSIRSDGGCVMRGNDLLTAAADVMVVDSLTGNLMVKIFSAFNSGGSYEALGYGYGPGVGENFSRIICILSRASGAPVVCEALKYAASCAQGGLPRMVREEFARAREAGLERILASLGREKKQPVIPDEKPEPAKKPVTKSIAGIDIMELENAVLALQAAGVYSESGMGCTGPIILVADEDYPQAADILLEKGFIR